MKKIILLIVFLSLSWSSSAQLQMGIGIGNGNFRKIMPYTESVINFPLTLFLRGSLEYKLKQTPYQLGIDVSFLSGHSWEESFNNYNNRAYARYFNQQSYKAIFNYSIVENSKLNFYTGCNLGYFRSKSDLFYTNYFGENYIVRWDKSIMHRFAFGANVGLIIGKKRLRTKIDVQHYFLSGYDFAGFAQEMNTSLGIGVVYLLSRK